MIYIPYIAPYCLAVNGVNYSNTCYANCFYGEAVDCDGECPCNQVGQAVVIAVVAVVANAAAAAAVTAALH